MSNTDIFQSIGWTSFKEENGMVIGFASGKAMPCREFFFLVLSKALTLSKENYSMIHSNYISLLSHFVKYIVQREYRDKDHLIKAVKYILRIHDYK